MTTSAAISEKVAKNLLGQHLEQHGVRLLGHHSAERVTFARRQYWAIVATVLLLPQWRTVRLGFHVYDNGEVSRVGRVA